MKFSKTVFSLFLAACVAPPVRANQCHIETELMTQNGGLPGVLSNYEGCRVRELQQIKSKTQVITNDEQLHRKLAATTYLNNKIAFDAALKDIVINGYEENYATYQAVCNDWGSLLHCTDAQMTALSPGGVQYQTTFFPDWNLIIPGYGTTYCAGCNGSFKLDFSNAVGSNGNGVYGVGFNCASCSGQYSFFVTYGDGSTENHPSFGNVYGSFWGITDDRLIKSIHFGNNNAPIADNFYVQIDNLVFGENKLEDIDDKVGSMGGDPHVKTWGGAFFDYMGECDLVLLEAPSFLNGGLSIHVRTTIRYDYSYIEAAVLRIGEDILEVSSFGDYAVNFVDNVDLLWSLEDGNKVTLSGFPIVHSKPSDKKQVFEVKIDNDVKIVITTFKDLVSVKVDGHGSTAKELFGDSFGMMGSFDDGAMLARDGTTVITDPEVFGQEWQVREEENKLFRTLRAPQLPMEQCRLPSKEMSMEQKNHRRLGEATITQEDAEAACAHLGNKNSAEKAACVFDVLATGDLDIAQAGVY